MTHFDEAECVLYLDGQLDAQRAAGLSAHAAVCSDCGALLSALEKESRLLGQALLEQDEPLPLRLREAPWAVQAPAHAPATASWALWAWALSFGLAAAAGFALWAILQPWTDQLDQVGFQASSLLSTAFFSGAFWEGWESMFDAMQYAAVISLGLLVLALWRPWRRQRMTIAIALVGLVLLLGLPSGASAAVIRRGPNAVVAAGETVDNDLIVFGNAARIDGTVRGDVIAFTQDITVNGHVTGDVIVFAQSARVDGQVDGNVRAFCRFLSLGSGAAKNVTVFAQRFDLDPRATVGGGLIGFVATAAFSGKITRDLLLFSGNPTLDGTVGGDVLFRGQRLQIGPAAQIAGRVHAVGQNSPDVAQGAKLAYPVEFEFQQVPRRGRFGAGTYVFRQILAYGGAFLCGLLLIKLFPGLFAAGRKATQRVGMAMSIGALVLVSGIALIIFAILLIIVGTGAGIATLMLFGPILYGSQVFVGSYVGEMILHKSQALAPSVGALALGLLILRLLSNIPFLGFFVLAAILIWGTGAICVAIWDRTRLSAAPTAAQPVL
jgi:cytoskeletal protein CcmA (bactofilin family)